MAVVLAYSPVLFNFFVGDDYVHLTWLAQAVNHPELVLRNFHTSWLDGTTTKFYRPLISVFMYTDYLLWGVNGLGFRITNLIFHLASTLFLFLILRLLSKQNQSIKLDWAYLSAAIFGLYPLHPEAVSWITGRVDSVVTAFCLAAIWFYLRWRQSHKPLNLCGALVSAALGLLSKEMAITLPAVFFAYEFFFNQAETTETNSQAQKTPLLTSIWKTFWAALRPTLPFCFLLVVYFIVRRFALGTFVGGYDNSLFFIANAKDFVLGWLHALKMLVVPINKNLLGVHNVLTKTWEVDLIAAAVFMGMGFYADKKSRPVILFAATWLLFCLLPVYKVFAISNDLQGSRLAYLATVPLSILLASGFRVFTNVRFPITHKVTGSLFVALCAAILWTNNQAWKRAGEENNAIRTSLQQLYSKIPGDPQILFTGLPDEIDGAYTCRNSLAGMIGRPLLDRDIRNSLMINPFEPILPFGYLKDSISTLRNSIYIFRWDSKTKQFAKVLIPEPKTGSNEEYWSGNKLQSVLSVAPETEAKYLWNQDGTLSIETEKKPCYLEFQAGEKDCWATNFVELVLQVEKSNANSSTANLLYANELNPEFELRRRTQTLVKANKEDQNLIFALRGLPDWTIGGKFNKLKVLLPPNSSLRIKSIAIRDSKNLMPILAFDNSGYFGSKGYFHLGPSEREHLLHVDCQSVSQAKSMELEITRTNLLFEQQNPQTQSAVVMKKINSPKLVEDFKLKFDEFPGAGIYELRAWAKDAAGNICGVGSDHIVISVDSP